jgi:hypothetical protein
MKKLFVLTLLLIGGFSAQSQLRIGLKAGANFSDLEGNFDTSMRTGFHFGGVLEIKAGQNFSIQPEVLYSMQGAKVTAAGLKDIDYNYITVPVLAKYYIVTDVFSIEAGPQFAFLVDDNISNTFKTQSFDFGAVGGIGLNITKSFFAQAHYVVGLTDTSTNADIKNRVIQLSLGYNFF